MDGIKDLSAAKLRPFRFPSTRVPEPSALRLRLGELVVRAAADLPDLQAVLALERLRQGGIPGRVGESSAVPECEFLMALDRSGSLVGVTRLLRHAPERIWHALPGTASKESSLLRLALPAPLLTAIRYSSTGVLEVGAFTLAPGAESETVASALWTGILAAAARTGIGYLVGTERVEHIPAEFREAIVTVLHAGHGLHPDLVGRPSLQGADWRRGRDVNPHPTLEEALTYLPPGLKEGLSRGCRLAGLQNTHPGDPLVDFTWVASRETLST